MISVEQIKQYNELLKTKKQQNERTKVEIELNEKNINAGLAELTKKLGKEVTFENIESIYEETMKSAELIVNNGMSIMNGNGPIESSEVTAEAPVVAPVETPVAAPVTQNVHTEAKPATFGFNINGDVSNVNKPVAEQKEQSNGAPFNGTLFAQPGFGTVGFIQPEESTSDSIDEAETETKENTSTIAGGGSLFGLFNNN